MSKNLKKFHNVHLFAVIAANAFVFYSTTYLNSILPVDVKPESVFSALKVLPASLGILLAGIFVGIFPAKLKESIVFLKMNHPLPGCRAFTHFARVDPRIDPTHLEIEKIPKDPVGQNRAWYAMYKQVENEESVRQAHKQYLFTRDYTIVALVIFIIASPIAYFLTSHVAILIIYCSVLFLQFIVVRMAAANFGERFVCHVLSEYAIKKAKSVQREVPR